MSATLSDKLKELLDSTVFVSIATDDVLISTTVTRRKATNLERDPRVTVMLQRFDSPQEYAEIRGTATLTTEGGQELIDELAIKYSGKRYGELNPAAHLDDPRVVVRITPRKVVGNI